MPLDTQLTHFSRAELLIVSEGGETTIHAFPDEWAVRKFVMEWAPNYFEAPTDEVMEHVFRAPGHHREGEQALEFPDVIDYEGEPEVEVAVVPDEVDETNGDNHYVVTGHYAGDLNEDTTLYVIAATSVEAQDLFKAHLKLTAEIKFPEVMVTLIVQIPGPPIAFFEEDRLIESPEPLTRDEPS